LGGDLRGCATRLHRIVSGALAAPTGKRMDAPCCDVFRLVNGKIQSFDCYPSGTVIFA